MRITLPETADWPFGDRTEIGADELNAYLASKDRGAVRAPALAVPDPPTTEADALAFWLGTKKRPGFVQRHRGVGWHVRYAKRQNVVGMPDVLMLLPMNEDLAGGFTLVVALELKIGDDVVTDAQRDAIARLRRVPAQGCVAGIVRYGTPRDGEWSQQEAAEAIERALSAG